MRPVLRLAIAGAFAAGAIVAASAIASDPATNSSDVTANSVPAKERFASFRDAPAAKATNERAREQASYAAARGDRSFDVREVRASRPQVHLGVGERVLCLSVTEETGSGSSGCADTSTAAAGDRPPVSLDLIGGGRYRVTGVFPDGITAVTVQSGGRAASQAVENNIFTTTVDDAPVTLTWIGLTGEPSVMTLRG